jgi:predicted nucleic-acid-binding Zn-ribbon protein
MKSGKCPKCSSEEIYKRPKFSPSSNIAVSFFTRLNFQIFVCTECGYLEAYIIESEDLKEIKGKWQKA